MPARAKRNSDGFSIVEVMTATTILLVGFVGLIQALTIGTEALDTARKQQVANQIVTAELEKLRGGAWTVIANLPASATINVSSTGTISGDATGFALTNFTADATDDNTTLRDLARGFTCTLERTRLRPSAATAATVTFVKVVYTVTWKSNTGRSHQHRLESYLAMNGLHLSYQQS
jgi:type II secretory pathway component PulJ